MFKSFKAAALSALIGIGTLSAVASTAQADDYYPRANGHHERRDNVQIGDDDDRRGEHRGQNRDRDNRWGRDNGWNRGDEWRRSERRDWPRGCSAERALGKAQYMGLRRARIADIGRHTISVTGHKWNQRMVVRFARAPNCPVIR